jgi:hypothetical protein
MSVATRFQPPTVAQRRQVADAMHAVWKRRPAVGELKDTITCTRCSGRISFTVLASGISRASCNTGGCIRWVS